MEVGKNSVAEHNNVAEAEHNNVGSFSDVESGDEETSKINEGNNNDGVRGHCQCPNDELMTLNVVSRITKVSGEAKQAMRVYLSEYISFITGEAKEHCRSEMRKTITAEDIVGAHANLGFQSYVEPLTLYLMRYRQYEATRRTPPLLPTPPPMPTPPPPGHYFSQQPTTQFAPPEGCYNDPALMNMDDYYSMPPPNTNISDVLSNPLYPQFGYDAFSGGGHGGGQAMSSGGGDQLTGGCTSVVAPHGRGRGDSNAPSGSCGSGCHSYHG